LIEMVCSTGEGLVDGVVNDFEDEMVEALGIVAADVNAGARAERVSTSLRRGSGFVVGVGVVAASAGASSVSFWRAGLSFSHESPAGSAWSVP